MGITIRPTVPVAQPEAEPWPVDEHTIRIDEMFARQLDTEFSAGVRGLLHHPETGIAALSGETALEAIAGALPALNELKQRTLSQAMGPRQRSILEPLIETRLNRAAGTLGQLAQRATVEVDDASVADRIASLNRDAASSWQDPAYLRQLGRTAVEELRYQGERRGWDPAETDTRVRGGLSDLYAGAIETAIGTAINGDDLDGAFSLYEHARPIVDPERQAALDRRFVRAREMAVYRDIDRDLQGIPLEPAGPPSPDMFEGRALELTPDDATDEMRARIAQVAEHAHRHAERQWNRQQAEAGVAAFDWIGKNPGRSFLAIPPEIRDWLAPDQWKGLEALLIEGRPKTARDVFERLDWQMLYAPDAFVGVDLDRHRLSLDDEDHARFTMMQKAIAEGRIDPNLARYDRMRRGIDRAVKALGIHTDSPAAVKVRADARDRLDGFETIEGRPLKGQDIDDIVGEEVERAGIAVTPKADRSSPAYADGQAQLPDNVTEANEQPVGFAPIESKVLDDGEATSGDFTGDPNIILAGGGRPPSRRGGGPPLTTFEQMRAANFRSTLESIRQLEPNNRELSYVAPPGWVPSNRDVARVREELAHARQRVAISGATPSGGNEPRADSEAFHYTREGIRTSIEQSGLYSGSYATTTGALSPLQAQIDLALPPNRGLPGAILRIDLNAMRAAGYEIPTPTRVGRSYNMPGGGYEMKFPYPIKPEFITVIK